ncbi:hypothetical protein GIB67_041145 [Kingdonia uniflora]|uniref:Non-specific lipid-transfer protein n=1 Tax=Kingdonia uniflora TaxID=39325 RepID=A0A7J7LKA8_9MAGN|nr:hypothetical protein GIB67_041145 [Kingdonia uniflora]
MASFLTKLTCVMLACMVISAPFAAEAAITCGTVVSKLAPCITFLRSGGLIPSGCCSGVQALNGLAKTTLDRKIACGCLKTAAASYNVNSANAAALPGKCGVRIPYKISTSTDCSKVQ